MIENPSPVVVPRRRRGITVWRDRYLSLLAILLVIAAWWLVTDVFHTVKPIIIPSPERVFYAFMRAASEGTGFQHTTLFEHAWASLSRLLAGWGMAVALGVPLGLLMGTSAKIEAIFDPLVEFVRPLPPTGYFILLLLWFGTGSLSKILMLFLAVFPYVLINTRSGVKGVRVLLLRMAQSMGASRWQTFRYVLYPSSLPNIFAGMRLGLGNAFATLVAAEIVAADSGLGRLILDGSRYLATDIVFVGIASVGVLALLGDAVLRGIERRAVPWRGYD